MAEEKKITNFKETDENQENNIPEETPKMVVQPDAPKKGLLAKFNGLKLWQKAAIIAGTATLIFVGGRWIFKSKKSAQPVKVVVPTDTVNNAADAAVQDLVNELAKTAEEAGTNVVNF